MIGAYFSKPDRHHPDYWAPEWAYTPNDIYKPTRQLIHILVDVVAKGGNYLLNVGPRPDGELSDEAYQRLEEIGRWMKINGEAIYGTRTIAPYRQDKVCYTSKKDDSLYGIYLADEGETLPLEILLKGIKVSAEAKVSLLGVKGPCKWRQTGEGLLVNIPAVARNNPSLVYAWAIKINQ